MSAANATNELIMSSLAAGQLSKSQADHLLNKYSTTVDALTPVPVENLELENKPRYEFTDVAPLFPQELKDLNRWIVRTADKHPYSAYEDDENRGPINPHDEQFQAEYDTALGALEQTTNYSGLGFVFNRVDGLTGIDFDHCVNAETREILPEVQAILAGVDSYAEFSPSGTGIHIIIKGWQFPVGPLGQEGSKEGRAEIYSGKRYFTVTGDHVPGTPLVVNDRDIGWLYERIIANREFVVAKKESSKSSGQGSAETESSCVIEKRSSVITTKYQTLMNGTITRSTETGGSDFAIEDAGQILVYPSQSEADYALLRLICNRLNTEDIDAIKTEFFKSPLGQRDKANRKDYLDNAIKNLFASPRLHVHDIVSSEDIDGDGVSIDRPKLMTEVGNARRLIEAHGRNIRYCHDWDSWYFFNGKVWVADRKAVHIQDLMKRMLIRMQNEANQQIDGIDGIGLLLSKLNKNGTVRHGQVLSDEETVILNRYKQARPLLDWAKASETNQKIRGAVEQARSEPGISIDKSQFDQNRMLCNLENGCLVFNSQTKSFEFRKHLREDLCTRKMPVEYQPDAVCPQFEAFLEWMFPDKEVRDYVLTYLSLSLTGNPVRAILILFGEGSNGKTTLIKTMFQVFGIDPHQYGTSVAFSTFSVGREESAGGARGDLIPLDGPRLITASESNKAHTKLDMARLKELTGGDLTVARGLYSPEIRTFYNQGKIILLTNNLPTISDDSDGAWERLKLVECKAYKEKKDQDEFLATKLAGEASGILNLLIRRLRVYFKEGLEVPASVMTATETYRGAENLINRFVVDRAESGKDSYSVLSSEFYSHYRGWAISNGEEPETQKAVTQYLERRLKVKTRHKERGTYLLGIRLKPSQDTTETGQTTEINFS